MRAWGALLSGVICLLLAGCAGYQLGPTGGQVAGARSIQVPFAKNDTLQPRLAEPVTLALRRGLQQDGTYRLTTGGEAPDVLVETTLERYERSPTAFRAQDVVTAQTYEIYLWGRVVAKEVRTGKVLLDRQVAAATPVQLTTDQTAVERQAIPLLADAFATKVVLAITEGTW